VTPLQRRYRCEGLKRGLTIAEWEVYNSLPMYSVYPEARSAKTFEDRGVFMYRNATDEERAALDVLRTKKARAVFRNSSKAT
jgi:hypothetical protein